MKTALSLLLILTATCQAELTWTDVDAVQKACTPDAGAAWRTIPWRLSLLEAQRTAAEQQKPIFIWAMDGHPMGCV